MSEENLPDESAPEAAAPARGSMVKTVAVIAAGLVGGVSAGAFGIGPAMSPSATDMDSAAVASDGPDGARNGGHGEGGGTGHMPHMLENLVLNPAGTKGTRFLLFSVGIEMSDAASDAAIKLRDAETRDRVSRVLGAKSLDELVDVSRRDQFRKEIAVALDSVFGAGKVRAVFFPQFVVQ